MSATDERLAAVVRELVGPVAADLEVDLIDVEVKGQRGSRVVKLIADTVGGLDIDDIATLSRRAGEVLDDRDVVDGSYTLEVTSPGTDRPLRDPRDFARNLGRDARVQRTGQAELTGTVVRVEDDTLVLEVGGDEVAVPFTELDHGKLVLPW
jgi:ribosome maturation factor RimP